MGSNTFTYRGQTFHFNGIDRVDSEIGYVPENVVTACKYCNIAKRDMTKDQFLDLVARIATHLNLPKVEGV